MRQSDDQPSMEGRNQMRTDFLIVIGLVVAVQLAAAGTASAHPEGRAFAHTYMESRKAWDAPGLAKAMNWRFGHPMSPWGSRRPARSAHRFVVNVPSDHGSVAVGPECTPSSEWTRPRFRTRESATSIRIVVYRRRLARHNPACPRPPVVAMAFAPQSHRVSLDRPIGYRAIFRVRFSAE